MRRVYVSNPATVDTVTPTPRDLVVTAKAAGTSSVIIWGESGATTDYTVLADLDVSGLNASLNRALPGSNITAESRQGRILLSGSVSTIADADQATKLAGIYSKDVVNSVVIARRHPAQVKLKVRFAEVDRSKLDQFGINLLSLNNNSGASTTGQYNQTTIPQIGGGQAASALLSDVLNLFYFNVPNGIGFTIKDLQTKGILEILAEPDLVTVDGQPAKFLAGGEFPFPVIQPGSGGGTATVTIQFRPYGVKLDFTPYVNADGTILLKVAPEVSSLDYTNVVVISGYTIPSLSTRRVETQIEVKNGQSFGISGILDRRTTDSFSRMPGIGDIPVLGQIFRSKSQNRSVMDLIVVVTPTIVDPLTNEMPASPDPSWVVPPGQINKFTQNLPKNYK
jgi:pilus assembly protein CpaC